MRGDPDGARALIERALELEPRGIAALLNMSRIAAAQKDNAGAERYLRQALEVDPAEPAALIGLAQVAMRRGDFAGARSLLERAPESTTRMLTQADLLGLEKRFDEASQLYAEVFALRPSELVALRAYEAARRAGRANADAQLRRWHAEHPMDPTTNFTLASLAIENKDLAAAERLYEAVAAVNPNHAATLNNLAWLYGERNDPRAIAFGERAYAAEPSNASIADTLGWLYVQNGSAARGLPLLAEAARVLPDQDDVHYHWAVALAETGDAARAIEILQRVTSSGREFSNRADAERRLNELRRTR
jgi:Tfp pilus assembly protein PilF